MLAMFGSSSSFIHAKGRGVWVLASGRVGLSESVQVEMSAREFLIQTLVDKNV